jgi:hypothetical protein
MWVGFALRIFKHIIDKDFPYTFKTDVGKTNIQRTVFNGFIVGIFFVFAFFIKADDKIDTSNIEGVITLISWIGAYLFWGWGIDSVFLWIMGKSEKTIKDKIVS